MIQLYWPKAAATKALAKWTDSRGNTCTD